MAALRFVWPFFRELAIFLAVMACAMLLAFVLAVANMLMLDMTPKEALGSNVHLLFGMAIMWWARRP